MEDEKPKFVVICNRSIELFEAKVNEKLEEGYTFQGNLYVNMSANGNYIVYHQAMINMKELK